MKRTLVNSSAISSVGYDPDRKILEIAFHHGGIYQYLNVPNSIYLALMQADSKGSYYDEYVKKAGYDFKQIA